MLRNHQPILRDSLWFCCSFNTGPSCFFPQRTCSDVFTDCIEYAAPIVVMIISWEMWHWGQAPWISMILWQTFAGMTSKQHPLWTASCFPSGIPGFQGMCISNLFTRRIIWKRFKRCYLVDQKKGRDTQLKRSWGLEKTTWTSQCAGCVEDVRLVSAGSWGSLEMKLSGIVLLLDRLFVLQNPQLPNFRSISERHFRNPENGRNHRGPQTCFPAFGCFSW